MIMRFALANPGLPLGAGSSARRPLFMACPIRLRAGVDYSVGIASMPFAETPEQRCQHLHQEA